MEVALVWWLMAFNNGYSSGVVIPAPYKTEEACLEAIKRVPWGTCVPQPKSDVYNWTYAMGGQAYSSEFNK